MQIFNYAFNLGGDFSVKMEGMSEAMGEFNAFHTCNRLRAVFLYIINLKPAITIYYNINVLNSLSSFCYLVFFICFLSAAIRTDAVLFLEATKQLGAMLNSCRSSLKNL